MTTAQLITFRKRIFAEMVAVFETCDKGGLPMQDGLEAVAAFRHLHDATCRELDYRDLEIGQDSYVLDIFRELDDLADDSTLTLSVRQTLQRCRVLLRKVHPSGGAA